MSYRSVGLGQDCPGQEVFDPNIGACMCPSGTHTTGTIGVCIADTKTEPGWGEVCPLDVPIIGGFNCMCPDGSAYDPAKNMCTRAAFGPQAQPGTSRASASSSSSPPLISTAGMSVGTGAAALAVLAGFGVLYAMGRG